jgi:hypothetical protein
MGQDGIIQLAEGAEDLGLAVMLRDLLGQNFEQNPHKVPDFIKLNIPIGLTVSDVDIDLTMAFSGGALVIYPGIMGKPALCITAEAETIMGMSNLQIKWGLPYYFDDPGREVLKAMTAGRLKVKGMLLHFPSLVRLSRIMSVH